ncbi:1370_t:CDS:2 [Entrophospora sp. SA101]|nr:1370_t:CDS:2 [Entrophospora sp. SA101]
MTSSNNNKWRIDFTNLADQARRHEVRGQVLVVDPPPPPGFVLSSSISTGFKGNLKAWDAALSPGKNIPMNVFMLWMSGNGVQIFSVMITGMLLVQPIKALMNIDSVFERYESSKTKPYLIWPKLLYVFFQFLIMSLGLYKCSSMGLLPTATSDWLAFMDPKQQKFWDDPMYKRLFL